MPREVAPSLGRGTGTGSGLRGVATGSSSTNSSGTSTRSSGHLDWHNSAEGAGVGGVHAADKTDIVLSRDAAGTGLSCWYSCRERLVGRCCVPVAGVLAWRLGSNLDCTKGLAREVKEVMGERSGRDENVASLKSRGEKTVETYLIARKQPFRLR